MRTESKPNIIFVFADQLRADVIGYAGDRKAITPNIDRFASQAIDMHNAVSVTPVCAAYRSSLLTGKYPSSTGMVINEINMNPNHRTIAHVLTDSGYNLGYVGKWHLNDQHGRPTPKGAERLGFDGFWAAYSFHHASFDSYYYTDDSNGDLVRRSLRGNYGPEVFTSMAVEYIDRANQYGPFALFLSWNPPHDPWIRDNVPAGNYDRFAGVEFTLPKNFKTKPDEYMDRFPEIAFDGNEWRDDFINGGLQESLRCYYGMVNSIDEQFGRIVAHLDRLGIADDTIVVFTSDHGEMFGSQGRMYKLTFYDEAARVPLLVRYPGRIQTGSTDLCINTPDIMPTLLGLAGLGDAIPPEVEGSDLSGLLRGYPGNQPAAAFMQGMGHTYLWEDGYEWRAVRDRRFTYAKYLRDGRELLFDRSNDPLCREDVVADFRYRENLDELRRFMERRLSELNDEFNSCSWYRDNWMYKDFSIRAAAGGTFGPLPPVEPSRKRYN